MATVGGKSLTEGNVERPKPTTENLPLLARLPSLHLAALVTKSLVRKHLLELTEESSEAENVEVLELVEDEGLRLFLFDYRSTSSTHQAVAGWPKVICQLPPDFSQGNSRSSARPSPAKGRARSLFTGARDGWSTALPAHKLSRSLHIA